MAQLRQTCEVEIQAFRERYGVLASSIRQSINYIKPLADSTLADRAIDITSLTGNLANLKDHLKQLELEKEKQDDALSVVSNLLGELKVMAIDMGSEIDRWPKIFEQGKNRVLQMELIGKGGLLKVFLPAVQNC